MYTLKHNSIEFEEYLLSKVPKNRRSGVIKIREYVKEALAHDWRMYYCADGCLIIDSPIDGGKCIIGGMRIVKIKSRL
jgi:hypothetical protein